MSQQEFIPKQVVGHELLTPLDIFRGGDFSTGTLVSGNITSGNGLNVRLVSGTVKMRVANVHLYNREGGWIEMAFYDGGRAGSRVLGPYRLQPYSERTVPFDEVQGRYFTSGIYAQALSGWVSQPLSNGVDIEVSWVPEYTDLFGV